MKKIKLIKLSMFVLGSLIAFSGSVTAQEFALIKNATNKVKVTGDEAKTLIKRLYLKQKTDWPTGTPAVPFLPEAGSAGESAFYKSVFGMTTAEVEAYWLKRKQQDGETPARAIGASRILLRQIDRKPGGVGVIPVSEAGALPANVDVLLKF